MKLHELFENRLHEVYQEEPGGSFTDNNVEYDLNKLFRLTEGDPIAYFATEDLAWVLPFSGIDPERVKTADITVPILVGVYKEKKKRMWVVLDGAHRLARAVREKVPLLPGKFVSPEVEQQTKI